MNQPGPHFLHGDAFELVRARAGHAVEPHEGAAPQLLGALSRHVDKEKAAGDRSREFLRPVRGSVLFV